MQLENEKTNKQTTIGNLLIRTTNYIMIRYYIRWKDANSEWAFKAQSILPFYLEAVLCDHCLIASSYKCKPNKHCIIYYLLNPCRSSDHQSFLFSYFSYFLADWIEFIVENNLIISSIYEESLNFIIRLRLAIIFTKPKTNSSQLFSSCDSAWKLKSVSIFSRLLVVDL